MRILVALLLATAAPACIAADPLYAAYGTGEIVIAPDGSVADVDVDQQFGEPLDAALERRMRGWRFEPIVEGGRAVQATGHMQFTLRARIGATDADTELKIADVVFVDPPGSPSAFGAHVKAPAYPAKLIRAHLGAELTLRVEVGADGRVERAALHSGHLLAGGRVRRPQAVLERFAEAAIRSTESWQFAPSADGSTRYVDAPFRFMIESKSLWYQVQPVAVTPEPWVTNDQQVAEYGASGAAPDPRIQLQTPLESVPEA